MTAPDIPDQMRHLPVAAGLAVPYVTATHRDGTPLFGNNDIARVQHCIRNRLCGVCGQRLAASDRTSIAFLLRPQDHRLGFTAEPALHPKICLPYATAACPALNGRMTRYRATLRTLRCADPACQCRAWAPVTTGTSAKHGAPIGQFFAATIQAGDYATTIRPDFPELGLVADLTGIPADRLRPVGGLYAALTRLLGMLGAAGGDADG